MTAITTGLPLPENSDCTIVDGNLVVLKSKLKDGVKEAWRANLKIEG
jgi:hypothetical protein